MSRHNKVNPGRYTQRGRLTQDDAARELRKQSLIGSPHTWQPVDRRRQPLAPAADANRQPEAAADSETTAEAPPRVKRAKAPKAKTATARKSKRTTAAATTGTAARARKAAPTAKKQPMARPARKAVRTRNVGRGGAATKRTTKRRSS